MVRVGCCESPWNGKRRVGSGKLHVVRNSEIGLVESGETGIDGRNGVLLPLLLVINEEPRSVRQDWPAHAPAKLLQNVYWLGESVRFADRIVGAGSGITIVVEPSSVQGVAA